jgi:hypothetical protein
MQRDRGIGRWGEKEKRRRGEEEKGRRGKKGPEHYLPF